MDADIQELHATTMMLTHVTAALWANFIASNSSDPITTCGMVAEESLTNLEAIYERLATGAPNPRLHITVQAILHREEGFWRMVDEEVRLRV